MKRVLSMIMFATALVAAPAAFADPPGSPPPPNDGCTGETCMADLSITLDIGGWTNGEGFAGAQAEGAETSTFAGVLKSSNLNVEGGLFADTNGCEGGCGTKGAWLSGFANENVMSEAGAIAQGSNSALAGVANATRANAGLTGTISFGSNGND